MAQQIGLTLSDRLSRQLEAKAQMAGLSPDYLIFLYIQYSLLHHDQVVWFEKQAGSKFPKEGYQQR